MSTPIRVLAYLDAGTGAAFAAVVASGAVGARALVATARAKLGGRSSGRSGGTGAAPGGHVVAPRSTTPGMFPSSLGADAVSDAGAPDPDGRRHPHLTRALAVFGLAVFAVSFPLVRVLVDAPEFFIAHGLSASGTVVFFVGLVVVVPAAGAAVASLPGRVGRGLRAAVVSVLALLGAAGLLQPLSSSSGLFVLGAVAFAVAFVVAERRSPAVRSVAASLSVLALLLVAWPLGPSRVGAYVRSPEAVALDLGKADVDPTSVVVIVFDELSLVPLLDSDLAVNRQRYPNFAALADTSHWFRSASSVSPQTSASVPALLSGVAPDLAKVPVASNYPTNLFLQLGRTHEVRAYQPITSLCPDSVCVDGAAAAPRRAPAASSADLLADSLLVFRHAVGSDAMRAALPSISAGWAGFGAGVEPLAAEGDHPGAAHGYGTFRTQVAQLQALAEAEPTTDRPQLRVAHLIAPHMPWLALPDGSTYEPHVADGLNTVGATLEWDRVESHRRAGHQRLLLQLGALDRALGDARRALEEQGLWDDAVVVVTADHGVQFEPGGARAVDAGGVEVTSVPLFVKEPGQRSAVVEDRPALTIDVVPTVLGLLHARSSSSFDGVDLFEADVPSVRRDAFLVSGNRRVTPDQTTESLREAVDRRSRWVTPDGGWDPVYQAGVDERLVGRPLAELGAGVGPTATWTRLAGETGRRHTVALDAAASTVLLVCGATVGAAAPASSAGPQGIVLFASPDHCPEPDAAEVAYLDRSGDLHQARRPS